MAAPNNQYTLYKLLIFVLILALVVDFCHSQPQFSYPRYSLKSKQKYQRKVNDRINECRPGCSHISDYLEREKCVRICASKECYNEIYASDELEEDEIDVRYNSFRGCVYTKIK
ncbi:hypothetical protein BOX15_Mlig016552g3 [Macrostomum lignano]|uniref:BPTI/Kunitz inhibitor domain-containing protein n=1 Tax=Macrostomum lignano TaxID=282301 RepID=A0A267G7Z8_9PLAT|nr:hypothetical protein BOX15_Mlig016552g3 [Macrostomum lignano]